MTLDMRIIMQRMIGQKGFTLVELIVVMAILAILAAIAIPKYNQVTNNAKNNATQANMRTIVSAVELYQAANSGSLPTASASIEKFLQSSIASLGPSGAAYSLTLDASSASIKGISPSGSAYTSLVSAATI